MIKEPFSFVDEEWVSTGGIPLELDDPTTEGLIGVVATSTDADVDAAAGAARRAFDDGTWPHVSRIERRLDEFRVVKHISWS